MNNNDMWEYFAEVETTTEYNGYFCSIRDALTIVILGSFCGLRNINQIQQWASSEHVSRFLEESFEIKKVPCYYWLLCLLKIVNPKSLNQCFIRWIESILPEKREGLTIAIDGKTVCSTAKMDKYAKPMHIVSAQIAELGITFGQQMVDGKSNEIPAVQTLLEMLKITGCMVVADALNCQKETAKVVIAGGADYLLSVKDNQKNLKEDIEAYVQDVSLQKGMNFHKTLEKNSGRIEHRSAYVTDNIEWLHSKNSWEKMECIGAIHTQTTTKKGTSSEWHYYISSRKLAAEELLHHARSEWSVETMHWLLDVHFGEDFCRVEDEQVQQNLNMIRKLVLNHLRLFKSKNNSKRPFSKLMFDCLLDSRACLKKEYSCAI